MEQNDVMLMVLQSLQDINTRLDGLEAGQKVLEAGQKALEVGQKALEVGQKALEVGQQAMTKRLDKIEDDTRHTRVLLEATDKNVRILAESHLNLIEKISKVEELEATLEDVKSDTDVIKQVVTWHSDSIKKVL